jgi:hypothetical protein
MIWTYVGEEIMTWRCLEEKIFSQFNFLLLHSIFCFYCFSVESDSK